jgi:hypothetical protein
MAPDHAPVPGNGTATNSIKPSHWNSSTGAALRRALSKRRSTIRAAEALPFDRKVAILLRYKIINGTGIMFLK